MILDTRPGTIGEVGIQEVEEKSARDKVSLTVNGFHGQRTKNGGPKT